MLKRYFKRDVKCPVIGYLSLHRGAVGEHGGDLLAGTF
jgi:hypothetical protein